MGKVHKEPIYEWGNTTAYHPYKRHSITNQGNMKHQIFGETPNFKNFLARIPISREGAVKETLSCITVSIYINWKNHLG